jgi:hypothetical protein
MQGKPACWCIYHTQWTSSVSSAVRQHGFRLMFVTAAGATAAAAPWSLLCRRHEDMSARLLEYAVDQQCIDLSRQQLQLIHGIISGGSRLCNGSSSSSQQRDCSDAPWMLQVGVVWCDVLCGWWTECVNHAAVAAYCSHGHVLWALRFVDALSHHRCWINQHVWLVPW